MTMVFAATGEVDYKTAVEAGKRAVAIRETLTDMNGIFTTYRRMNLSGPAWMPGEVEQYEELLKYTDGSKGTLIAKLPLEWAFHRDPYDTGLARGWAYKQADLDFWNQHGREYTASTRKDYPISEWEMVRTDIYPQAQGILHPDWQSYTGYAWYKTEIQLEGDQAGDGVHIRLPGLFSQAWLYVNGYLVAHRAQGDLWWLNDYKFEWDVDLSGKCKPGLNDITIRIFNNHHMSGMFRRGFLYLEKGGD